MRLWWRAARRINGFLDAESGVTRRPAPSVSRSVTALVDDYLEVVRARWRRNTLWATAYDLKVFFTVVGKDPVEVTVADVLGFIRTQRGTGSGKVVRLADRDGRVGVVDGAAASVDGVGVLRLSRGAGGGGGQPGAAGDGSENGVGSGAAGCAAGPPGPTVCPRC